MGAVIKDATRIVHKSSTDFADLKTYSSEHDFDTKNSMFWHLGQKLRIIINCISGTRLFGNIESTMSYLKQSDWLLGTAIFNVLLGFIGKSHVVASSNFPRHRYAHHEVLILLVPVC